MDKLYEAVKSFEKLLNVQYKIVAARKGKTVDIDLCFSKIDFHHLMGLGKLKDLRLARENRETVFDDILQKRITYNSIKKSKFIDDIENRFEPLRNIEKLIDSNNLVFRYNPKINVFSMIEADYLLATPHLNNDIYIFISQKDNANNYFCRSFFPKENKDYTERQPQFTILKKEKINLKTNEKTIFIDKLSTQTSKLNEIKPIEFTIDTGSVNQNDGTMALSQPKVISIPNPLKPLGSLLEKAKSAITNFADSFKTSPKPKQAQNRPKSTTKKTKGNSMVDASKPRINDSERSEKPITSEATEQPKKESVLLKISANKVAVKERENDAPKKERQAPKKDDISI